MRRPAADGQAEIAVVKSWVLIPSGKSAVLTRGRLSLSVYAVGPPSSKSLGDYVTGTLSSSPKEVEATWFVNDQLDGNSAWGVILHEGSGGTLSVKYLPPDCLPQDNPVSIHALIQNTGGFFKQWYQPTGVAWVRVVPRIWRLDFYVDTRFNCSSRREGGGTASNFQDHLGWNATLILTLSDETLRIASEELHTEARHGTPTYCGPYANCGKEPVIRAGFPPSLHVSLGGGWIREDDTFNLIVSMLGAGPSDYTVPCTGDFDAQTTGLYANFLYHATHLYQATHDVFRGKEVPFISYPDGFTYTTGVKGSTTITGTLKYECQ